MLEGQMIPTDTTSRVRQTHTCDAGFHDDGQIEYSWTPIVTCYNFNYLLITYTPRHPTDYKLIYVQAIWSDIPANAPWALSVSRGRRQLLLVWNSSKRA